VFTKLNPIVQALLQHKGVLRAWCKDQCCVCLKITHPSAVFFVHTSCCKWKLRNRSFLIGIVNLIYIYICGDDSSRIIMMMIRTYLFMNALVLSQDDYIHQSSYLKFFWIQSCRHPMFYVVPISVLSNVVIVVDINKLDDPNNLLCDDMGVWKNDGVDTLFPCPVMAKLIQWTSPLMKWGIIYSETCIPCSWNKFWFKETNSVYL